MSTTFRPYAPDSDAAVAGGPAGVVAGGHLAHHVSDLVAVWI